MDTKYSQITFYKIIFKVIWTFCESPYLIWKENNETTISAKELTINLLRFLSGNAQMRL